MQHQQLNMAMKESIEMININSQGGRQWHLHHNKTEALQIKINQVS
jgi:hypothetical protein